MNKYKLIKNINSKSGMGRLVFATFYPISFWYIAFAINTPLHSLKMACKLKTSSTLCWYTFFIYSPYKPLATGTSK